MIGVHKRKSTCVEGAGKQKQQAAARKRPRCGPAAGQQSAGQVQGPQVSEESVWIFGLINNIEQLLSTFSAVNSSAASSPGASSPSSPGSSQSSSPAGGSLARSPISRQIKFHEYKGPPSAKRPQQVAASSTCCGPAGQHQEAQLSQAQHQEAQQPPAQRPEAQQRQAQHLATQQQPAQHLETQQQHLQPHLRHPDSSAAVQQQQQQPAPPQQPTADQRLTSGAAGMPSACASLAAKHNVQEFNHYHHHHHHPASLQDQGPQEEWRQDQVGDNYSAYAYPDADDYALLTGQLCLQADQAILQAGAPSEQTRAGQHDQETDACELEPSIGFGSVDELIFSEFIDSQSVPLNVDESDWLKKFLPPCSLS